MRYLQPALVAAALLAAGPRLAVAQPAARPAADSPEPASDPASAHDREALAAAEALATEASAAIEQWLSSQAISEDRLFARLYFPIAKSVPPRYTTPYDALAERDLVPIEDKQLARSQQFHYAIVTDVNAYVPAHNSRFARPLSGDAAQDYQQHRSRRLLGDPASLFAARNTAHHLVQRTRLDSGEIVYDVAVPITVRGKHWGCARIGYRRPE